MFVDPRLSRPVCYFTNLLKCQLSGGLEEGCRRRPWCMLTKNSHINPGQGQQLRHPCRQSLWADPTVWHNGWQEQDGLSLTKVWDLKSEDVREHYGHTVNAPSQGRLAGWLQGRFSDPPENGVFGDNSVSCQVEYLQIYVSNKPEICRTRYPPLACFSSEVMGIMMCSW